MRVGRILAGVCLMVPITARAATLYATGFESPAFSVGQLAGQGGFSGSPVGQVESGIAYTGTQAAVFNTTGNNGQFGDNVSVAFTPSGDNDVLELQAEEMFTTASNNGNFEVLAADSDAGFLDQLVFDADGTVTIGGASSNVGAVPVAFDTWNTYDLFLNFATQTATGYVDGTLIGSEPFAVAATSFTSIGIGINSSSGATNSGYFDDLLVTSVAPEPSTLLLLGTGVLAVAGAVRGRLSAPSA